MNTGFHEAARDATVGRTAQHTPSEPDEGVIVIVLIANLRPKSDIMFVLIPALFPCGTTTSKLNPDVKYHGRTFLHIILP